MIRKLMELYHKHEEAVLYLLCGGITTIVNFAAYHVLTARLGRHYMQANIIAWCAAVAAAFVLNKALVFKSLDWSPRTALRELAQMAAARLATLGMETGILYVAVERLRADRIAILLPAGLELSGDMAVKLAASVLVVLANYAFSKLVIFRKREAS